MLDTDYFTTLETAETRVEKAKIAISSESLRKCASI
jgi:hypothetical protein